MTDYPSILCSYLHYYSFTSLRLSWTYIVINFSSSNLIFILFLMDSIVEFQDRTKSFKNFESLLLLISKPIVILSNSIQILIINWRYVHKFLIFIQKPIDIKKIPTSIDNICYSPAIITNTSSTITNKYHRPLQNTMWGYQLPSLFFWQQYQYVHHYDK